LQGYSKGAELEHKLSVIARELRKEEERLTGFTFPKMHLLAPDRVDMEVLNAVDESLRILVDHYRRIYKEAERGKEELIMQMTATAEGREAYFRSLDAFRNESLAEVVTNKNDLNVIVEEDGELVQKSDPVYLEPVRSGFFGAQFYAPAKYFLGQRASTLWANTAVLWAMSLLLGLALYFELFPWLVARLSRR